MRKSSQTRKSRSRSSSGTTVMETDLQKNLTEVEFAKYLHKCQVCEKEYRRYAQTEACIAEHGYIQCLKCLSLVKRRYEDWEAHTQGHLVPDTKHIFCSICNKLCPMGMFRNHMDDFHIFFRSKPDPSPEPKKRRSSVSRSRRTTSVPPRNVPEEEEHLDKDQELRRSDLTGPEERNLLVQLERLALRDQAHKKIQQKSGPRRSARLSIATAPPQSVEEDVNLGHCGSSKASAHCTGESAVTDKFSSIVHKSPVNKGLPCAPRRSFHRSSSAPPSPSARRHEEQENINVDQRGSNSRPVRRMVRFTGIAMPLQPPAEDKVYLGAGMNTDNDICTEETAALEQLTIRKSPGKKGPTSSSRLSPRSARISLSLPNLPLAASNTDGGAGTTEEEKNQKAGPKPILKAAGASSSGKRVTFNTSLRFQLYDDPAILWRKVERTSSYSVCEHLNANFQVGDAGELIDWIQDEKVIPTEVAQAKAEPKPKPKRSMSASFKPREE